MAAAEGGPADDAWAQAAAAAALAALEQGTVSRPAGLELDPALEADEVAHAAAAEVMAALPSFGGSASRAATGPSGPLCFDPSDLSRPEFDAAEFVTLGLERSGVSLPRLRDDLASYGAALRRELVDMLNRDYADFVGLSTSLVGTAETVVGLEDRLWTLRARVREASELVGDALSAVDAKLSEADALRARRAQLETLRGTHVAAERAASLLREPAEPNATGALAALDEAERLERAARQLERLRATASGLESHSLVQEALERAAVLGRALDRRLEVCFLEQASAGAAQGAPCRNSAIAACLRAYAVAGPRGAAETAWASRVFRPPLRDQLLTRERVAAAMSDWRRNAAATAAAAATTTTTTTHPTAHLPPLSSSSQLRTLLDEVIGWLHRCAAPVLSVASRLPLDFDFAGAAWAEVAAAVGEQAPVLCVAGTADEFHHGFSEVQRLARFCESLCPDDAALQRLRAAPCTAELRRRWNLPVYFQLRLHHAVSELEGALEGERGWSAAAAAAAAAAGPDVGVGLHGPATAWRLAVAQWDPGVWLPDLAPNFLRLSLQLLGRCSEWADASLETSAAGPADSVAAWVRPLSLAADLRTLRGLVWSRLGPLVSGAAACAGGDPAAADKARRLVEHALAPLLRRLDEGSRAQLQRGAQVVASQCAAPLQGVQRVRAAYQMTGRAAPTAASEYVSGAFAPLRAAAEALRQKVAPDDLEALGGLVGRAVASGFARLVNELMVSVRQTEASLQTLQRLKGAGGGLAGAGRAAAGELSDSDKMRVQLRLDLLELCRQGELSGTGPLPELVGLAEQLDQEVRSS